MRRARPISALGCTLLGFDVVRAYTLTVALAWCIGSLGALAAGAPISAGRRRAPRLRPLGVCALAFLRILVAGQSGADCIHLVYPLPFLRHLTCDEAAFPMLRASLWIAFPLAAVILTHTPTTYIVAHICAAVLPGCRFGVPNPGRGCSAPVIHRLRFSAGLLACRPCSGCRSRPNCSMWKSEANSATRSTSSSMSFSVLDELLEFPAAYRQEWRDLADGAHLGTGWRASERSRRGRALASPALWHRAAFAHRASSPRYSIDTGAVAWFLAEHARLSQSALSRADYPPGGANCRLAWRVRACCFCRRAGGRFGGFRPVNGSSYRASAPHHASAWWWSGLVARSRPRDEIEMEYRERNWGTTAYNEFRPVWGEATSFDLPQDLDSYRNCAACKFAFTKAISTRRHFDVRLSISSRTIRFWSSQRTARSDLRLRQFYMPGWRLTVDGEAYGRLKRMIALAWSNCGCRKARISCSWIMLGRRFNIWPR